MKKPYSPQEQLIQRIWVGWICLIFITSCFVVPFDTFIYFVQNLSSSAAFRQWFDQFWVRDGFYVVKGWHMTEYAILVSLTISTLRRAKIGSRFSRIGMALAFAVVFAASDEWHQTFVPGRDGNVRDVCIDTGGAFIAATVWSVRLWFVNRKTSSK